jgi:hypothetical protein
MLLFTAKTRHLIDVAIQRLPDESHRQLWRAWVQKNPQLRRPDGIVDDGGPSPPRDVLLVMVSALDQLEANERQRMNSPGISEDERSDLENDLTYITAVSRLLHQIPSENSNGNLP